MSSRAACRVKQEQSPDHDILYFIILFIAIRECYQEERKMMMFQCNYNYSAGWWSGAALLHAGAVGLMMRIM